MNHTIPDEAHRHPFEGDHTPAPLMDDIMRLVQVHAMHREDAARAGKDGFFAEADKSAKRADRVFAEIEAALKRAGL